MIHPTQSKILAYEDRTMEHTLNVLVGGVAFDLTGYTITAQARPRKGGDAYTDITIVTDDVNGIILLTLDSDTTRDMGKGVYMYDVRAESPLGVVSTWFEGKLHIRPTTSRNIFVPPPPQVLPDNTFSDIVGGGWDDLPSGSYYTLNEWSSIGPDSGQINTAKLAIDTTIAPDGGGVEFIGWGMYVNRFYGDCALQSNTPLELGKTYRVQCIIHSTMSSGDSTVVGGYAGNDVALTYDYATDNHKYRQYDVLYTPTVDTDFSFYMTGPPDPIGKTYIAALSVTEA